MAYTQADLDAVETAIATGRLMVTINGRQITYKSNAELLRAKSDIVRALNRAAAKSSGGSSMYSVADFR